MRLHGDFSRTFISQKFSRRAFETHFSECVPLSLQPSFKILCGLMPTLGLSDQYRTEANAMLLGWKKSAVSLIRIHPILQSMDISDGSSTPLPVLVQFESAARSSSDHARLSRVAAIAGALPSR